MRNCGKLQKIADLNAPSLFIDKLCEVSECSSISEGDNCVQTRRVLRKLDQCLHLGGGQEGNSMTCAATSIALHVPTTGPGHPVIVVSSPKWPTLWPRGCKQPYHWAISRGTGRTHAHMRSATYGPIKRTRTHKHSQPGPHVPCPAHTWSSGCKNVPGGILGSRFFLGLSFLKWVYWLFLRGASLGGSSAPSSSPSTRTRTSMPRFGNRFTSTFLICQ